MNLYFDNAATTCVKEGVVEKMKTILTEYYGNPSSLHEVGHVAEKKITQSKEFFANELGVKEKDIYFTSGGTESNNLAIQGIVKAYKRSGNHIITTTIEHASVGSVISAMEEEGCKVTRLQVDKMGQLSKEALIDTITDETILISIMQVNNEIGSIQNINELGALIKEKNPNTIFHVDGVQGFMKFPIHLQKAKVDLYSASAHKLHGPKGCGILYISPKIKFKPLFFGGQQQKTYRPGTENVPGIIGFYTAAKLYKESAEASYNKVCQLKAFLYTEIGKRLPHWTFNSPISNNIWDMETVSPYIVNIRTSAIKGEVVLHSLEDYRIYVSTGSACSSKKLNVSHVLKAIGLDDVESDRSIRISISGDHEREDIKALVDALVSIDQMFGRFIKR